MQGHKRGVRAVELYSVFAPQISPSREVSHCRRLEAFSAEGHERPRDIGDETNHGRAEHVEIGHFQPIAGGPRDRVFHEEIHAVGRGSGIRSRRGNSVVTVADDKLFGGSVRPAGAR